MNEHTNGRTERRKLYTSHGINAEGISTGTKGPVRLDLQAMSGGGDGTEKNFGPIPIIRPYMNSIHPRV